MRSLPHYNKMCLQTVSNVRLIMVHRETKGEICTRVKEKIRRREMMEAPDGAYQRYYLLIRV